MALFKNLRGLLLFLRRIFNVDGPGRASGKVEGVGHGRPGGARVGALPGPGFSLQLLAGLGGGWKDNAILMCRDEGAQPRCISQGTFPGTFYGKILPVP